MNPATPNSFRERESLSPSSSSWLRNGTLSDNISHLSVDMQLKHMTNENQRKDLLILDLRKQVSELLRYREQASSFKAQVSLVEERERLRESEANTKNGELLERVRELESIEGQLRGLVIRLEEDKSEQLRKNSHQSADIQAQLAAMRADAERRESVRLKLEYELTLASKAATQYTERERTERVLTEQIALMNSEKVEIERECKLLSESNTRLESEIRTLSTLNEKCNFTCDSLHSDLESLRGLVKAQENELKARKQDAGTITALQQELQVIPGLRGEIARLTEILTDADNTIRILEEEKARLTESKTQLQQKVSEYSKRTEDLVHVTGLLQDHKTKLELASADVERSRSLADKLKDQLAKTRARLDVSHSELHKIVSNLRDHFGVTAPRDEASRGDYVEILWGELFNFITKLFAEASQLESARATVRHFEELNVHLEAVNSSLEKEKLSLLSNVARLEAEINSHRNYMQTLCKDISQTFTDTTKPMYTSNQTTTSILNASPPWNTNSIDSISMMHVFLSERLAKLNSLNENYHKNLDEKARALAEKTRELNELQQRLTQDNKREREKNVEHQQFMEQKHQTTQSDLKANLDRAELELYQLRESLKVAEQTALNIEARYKESLLRITAQTEELELVCYAVELMVRVLRPLRVRYNEVVAQKRMLSSWRRDSETIHDGVSVLAQALTGQLDDTSTLYSINGKRRKHAGMRAAAIAVIAHNRFCKMISSPYYRPLAGVPLKVGRENFALAPSCIISHITDAPHLVMGDDLASLSILIAHFDHQIHFDDSILDPRLLFALQSGLPRRIRYKDSVLTFKHLPAQECLAVVRKATLEIMRRLKDTERDRNELYVQLEQLGTEVVELRKDHDSMDVALAHSQELCAILEDRVHHLQEEEVPVQTLRAAELKGSLQEQTERVTTLSQNMQKMKKNLKEKEAHMDDLTADLFARDALLDSLRGDLASKDALLDTYKREMSAKDALLIDLKDDIHAKAELILDFRTKDRDRDRNTRKIIK